MTTGRPMRMEATAFAQDSHPTSAGTVPHFGIVAADPAVLPLGSVIRVSGVGAYDGVYLVTDTGRLIHGRHIDIYIPSVTEAREFGRKTILVELLEAGRGRQDARDKDIPAAQQMSNFSALGGFH